VVSDTILGALIGVAGMLAGIWLKNRFKASAASQTAAQTECRTAQQRERSEARRRDQTERDNRRMEQERLAARLNECWEQVLLSRRRMGEWVDYFQGRRRWGPSPRDELASVFSGNARGMTLLDFPLLHPLAVAYHDATAQLELAIRDRLGKGRVNGMLADWERAYQSLEEEVAKMAGALSDIESK